MQMDCTIVTCYYRFPSKHAYSSYDSWMHNMLTTIDTPMVIFCDEDWVEPLTELRKGFEAKTKIIVRKWNEMYCASPRFLPYWRFDHSRDSEAHYHNELLYILWNEKSAMVNDVINMNPFKTDFFCWCDIGCFRDSNTAYMYKRWPSNDFLNSAAQDKMFLLNIEPFQNGELDILENGLTHSFEGKNRVGGTIFLGHKDVWHQWCNVYYTVLDRYLECKYFAGKDQNVMATVVALHPSLVKLVTPTRNIEDGDPWFYLQRYFLKRPQ